MKVLISVSLSTRIILHSPHVGVEYKPFTVEDRLSF